MTYTIQAGDTLTAIARHFGVSVASIASANGIDDSDYIQTGQTLTIPKLSAPITYSSSGDVLAPVTVQSTVRALPAPLVTFNFAEWLKPPKLYYLLAAGAVLAWLMGQKSKR